ncbi:hypothetical protein JJL52_12970 [Methylomicrobium sp. RS1]|uniref:hypothetical protein n=1 Tax=Methylomicrobium agile TaxID=39774 RepID=UPI000AB13355|nr:hypothetical protein [Methylomicrobium agile]MBL1264587.1 hypothetical protein [Methylomicrobium sp. RS1]
MTEPPHRRGLLALQPAGVAHPSRRAPADLHQQALPMPAWDRTCCVLAAMR